MREVRGKGKCVYVTEAKARVCSKVGNIQLIKARYLGVICNSLIREVLSDKFYMIE